MSLRGPAADCFVRPLESLPGSDCAHVSCTGAGSAESLGLGLCGFLLWHFSGDVLTITELLNVKSRRVAKAAALRYRLSPSRQAAYPSPARAGEGMGEKVGFPTHGLRRGLRYVTRVQNSFRAWCLGQQTMLSPCSRQSEKPFEMGLNSDLRCISKILGSGKPPRAVLDSIETFSETQFWTKQCCTQDKGLNPSKTPFQRCFGHE